MENLEKIPQVESHIPEGTLPPKLPYQYIAIMAKKRK